MEHKDWDDDEKGTVTMTKKEFQETDYHMARLLLVGLFGGTGMGFMMGFILGGGLEKFFGLY